MTGRELAAWFSAKEIIINGLTRRMSDTGNRNVRKGSSDVVCVWNVKSSNSISTLLKFTPCASHENQDHVGVTAEQTSKDTRSLREICRKFSGTDKYQISRTLEKTYRNTYNTLESYGTAGSSTLPSDLHTENHWFFSSNRKKLLSYSTEYEKGFREKYYTTRTVAIRLASCLHQKRHNSLAHTSK